MVSARERESKYRSKMSQDKKDAVKEKDKIRKKMARSKMSGAQLEHEKVAARQRMWKLRQRRKKDAVETESTLTSSKDGIFELVTSPFGSRQAQGKAVKRVQVNLR